MKEHFYDKLRLANSPEWKHMYHVPRWARRYWPDETAKKANIACGQDYRPGWDNIDLYAPRADKRIDLFSLPWPIEANTYDFILAGHFIEHIPPRL